MKTIAILLILLVFGLAIIPTGIQNKFENFKDCFGGSDKKCNQFDYLKDGTVGFNDFIVFANKYTKMIK